ncbi:biotin synthase BioB [Geovibrio thiophilus]|uniref:Biotin synthase n=1 Tax=Geovibrio thiophilus TaxID=139438 RepID=A0A3R5XXQ1_9BACT|nr:biotin synthase BioB [Geovibrio thiophilus]QAR33320.1 biotin synthase BioB [Geovibrio thiophilus]
MIENLYTKCLRGHDIDDSDIELILNTPLEELLEYSYRLKKHFFADEISTCGIINAKSGLCSEDCIFCAQSAHHRTGTPVYPYIDIEEVRTHAARMAEAGVKRYAAVISGKSPNEHEFELLRQSVEIITSFGLDADISVGILTEKQLLTLKASGLKGYHHNLETSRSFFRNICTTHEYDEDVNAVKAAVKAGLYVCSGGIFGIGESWQHRVELARELKAIGVQSVPINFLNPITGTPLEGTKPLPQEEALRIVALFRFMLPEKHVRVCGGRTLIFPGEEKGKLLKSGISGLMVGDYLVVKGEGLQSDMDAINRHISAEKGL